jgi:hypothetical protein
MNKALLVWFCVVALVAVSCSSPADDLDNSGSIKILGDSGSWVEIWDWYDLDDIRNNVSDQYILMDDLDSTTAGYEELASLTANGGKGWQPIGTSGNPFNGLFNGQGYEIKDVFINRTSEPHVGLFGVIGEGGISEDVGVVNATVTGQARVGGLVGENRGIVSNSYSMGNVTGTSELFVGGLAGGNSGTVINSYFTGSVTGAGDVGGLVGANWGTVSNSYSTGSVAGEWIVGGLVGWNHEGTVSNSYCIGSVTGGDHVGGLVGENHEGTVSNSYYDYDEVLINGENIITIGALFGEDFDEWLANDKFLNVNERLSQGYYLINNVSDFKELLAFGQDDSLKFRLKNDLDLAAEPNFYIPYLAGEFDGNGRKIANLNLSFDFISQVGLFGYLASGGKVSEVGVENVNITGDFYVGGLVGENDDGTVSNSYSSGSVTGARNVGGLVGWIGWNGGTVSNSYYNCDEVLINGENIITIGALFGEDFDEWLANDKFLNVNERLSQEDGYYLINNVSDFKELLAFGQDDSLKFRLKNDLDLAAEPNFYIPYLAGEFDGNVHKICNLSLHFNFVAQVGLFGYLGSVGKVSQLGVESVNVTVTDDQEVGGLAGRSDGTVSNCYSTGSLTGMNAVGGLVGTNEGTVSNSYSTASLSGGGTFGGLVGGNRGTVSNSYSTGSVTVTGSGAIGGLVGGNLGTVSNSFWDIETSGQATSDGGKGKTTAEMKNIATFADTATEGLDEPWDIIGVALGETNSAYTWNIVDSETYPFLTRKQPEEHVQYDLSISSTAGGSVNTPGEGTFIRDAGTVVSLLAIPSSGYRFVNWTGDVGTIANANSASTTITMNSNYEITATFEETPIEYVTTVTGTGTASFSPSQGNILDLIAVATPPSPPVELPHGMFSFKVILASGQTTVTITIMLPGPVPVGTKWWKYHAGSWYSLPIGDDDGDKIITITLTDGDFPGDADSIAGQITDPGGPGNPGPGMAVGWETYPINKVRVLLPWITLLTVIIAGVSLLVLRRRGGGPEYR